MTWIALQLAAGGLLMAAGIRMARWSRGWTAAAGGLLLSLIVLKAVVGHIPAAEPALFSWDWYPYVEPSWYLVPAMFLVGAGFEITRRAPGRRGVMLAAAGLLMARTTAAGWITMRSVEVRGTVADSAVCLQTSGVSCGAAAAASFLYYYGIRTTEQEMAALCVTRDGGRGLAGTSDAGLVRGLRKKLAGRLSVQIARQTYEELSTPALVPIEVYPGVGHCVLVWRADPELVHLLDPRCGRTTMSRAGFEKMWTGSAIWAEQDRP